MLKKKNVVIRLFKIGGDALATGREGLAAIAVTELLQGKPQIGEYLKSYDPEAYDGRGDATFTPDISEAKRFPGLLEAHEFWRQQSKNRPLRSDGKPNRPLTAFSITFEKVYDPLD